MFEGIRNIREFKQKIRDIQREHFADVADAEAHIHEMSKAMLDMTTKYEVEKARYEDEKNREIMNLKHAIKLREEEQKLELEKIKLEHKDEIDRARAAFKDEKFDEMKNLLSRETEMQRNIMNVLIKKLPENIGIRNIQEGSPTSVLRIEDGKKEKEEEKS